MSVDERLNMYVARADLRYLKAPGLSIVDGTPTTTTVRVPCARRQRLFSGRRPVMRLPLTPTQAAAIEEKIRARRAVSMALSVIALGILAVVAVLAVRATAGDESAADAGGTTETLRFVLTIAALALLVIRGYLAPRPLFAQHPIVWNRRHIAVRDIDGGAGVAYRDANRPGTIQLFTTD